jgi:glycosyltransferase involved in cell wall biosynthesis
LADKGVHIPNFFDTESFRRIDARTVKKFKREEGIAPGAFVLFFAGRLDPMKNLEALLAAVDLLWRRGIDLILLTAGEGRLRSRIENHPRCVCLGELNTGRLNTAFNAADLTVLPSLCENSPSVVMESIAAGTAVLSTDVGDVADMLPPELIIRGFSAEAIAARIESIIFSDADKLRSRVDEAGNKLMANFSPAPLVARKLELYTQLWSSRRGG